MIDDTFEWRKLAACRGMTHLFFPAHAERPNARAVRENAARALCRTCRVVQPCREDAASDPEHAHGIWGDTETDTFVHVRM